MKTYSPLLGEKLSYEGDCIEEVKKIYREVNRLNIFIIFPRWFVKAQKMMSKNYSKCVKKCTNRAQRTN